MRGVLTQRSANKWHEEEAAKKIAQFQVLTLQWELEAGTAKKLYEENSRKAVSIKVPKTPSREVQDHHNLTHIPF